MDQEQQKFVIDFTPYVRAIEALRRDLSGGYGTIKMAEAAGIAAVASASLIDHWPEVTAVFAPPKGVGG